LILLDLLSMQACVELRSDPIADASAAAALTRDRTERSVSMTVYEIMGIFLFTAAPATRRWR
jgi:hypothetical protein